MPVVTQLKPQKNSKQVSVYLDNKFAFGIDIDNLVKFGIKVEKEFSQEEIDKIVHEAEFARIYNKFLNFATLRPRSEQELFNWLKRKKVPDSFRKRLFSKLKRLGLVNESAFAKWWIEQRKQFKFKSKKELVYELRQKGVGKNIIDDALEEVEVDEEKAAKRLLEKRKFKDPQKAFAYLARKGFGYDIIKNVVQYSQENNND